MEDRMKYKHQVGKFLTTPILTMGTETPLVILNLTICAMWVITAQWSLMSLWAILIFVAVHFVCIQVSKNDPRLVRIFLRRRKYRGYYPAIAGEQVTLERSTFKSKPDEYYGNVKTKLT